MASRVKYRWHLLVLQPEQRSGSRRSAIEYRPGNLTRSRVGQRDDRPIAEPDAHPRFSRPALRLRHPRRSGSPAHERQGSPSLPRRRAADRAASTASRRSTRRPRTAQFKHRAEYTEGRKVRNSRDQRAIDKRSKHGRAQDEAAWRSTEVDMIHRLHAAGVRVPVPQHFIDGVLIMELITDAEGNPAPRLADLGVRCRRRAGDVRAIAPRGGPDALRRGRARRPLGLQRPRRRRRAGHHRLSAVGRHGAQRQRAKTPPPRRRQPAPLPQPVRPATCACLTPRRCGSSFSRTRSRRTRGSRVVTVRPSGARTPTRARAHSGREPR
jgi:hypothetical protein